jgi:hypothetical protein
VVGDALATQKTKNCPLIEGVTQPCDLYSGAQASLMRKRQRSRESEKVISSPLIIHRLQVSISCGESVITSAAAQGAALAINSTFETGGGKLRAPLSYGAAE